MEHQFARKTKPAPGTNAGWRTAPTPVRTHRRGFLQRKCACGTCAACGAQQTLQRDVAGDNGPATAPKSVRDVLRSPGEPLDAATRAYMEPRFGHDFSGVRIHADAKAAESARAINASAYTAGRSIVFGAAKYRPETNSGTELLAHELTHSIQQGATGSDAHTKYTVGNSGDAAEQEADVTAALVARGRSVSVTTGQDMHVARQVADTELPTTGATATATADTTGAAVTPPETEVAETCALTTYTGSNLVGEAVTADVEFTDSLDTINQHAADNSVNLHVTSSFRTSTDVPGAIVTPATMSNHLVGHAIDMNVKYGENKDKLCNSTCLGGVLPAGVSGFIKAIQDDAGLRWGGDFSDKDPVHIDDNLNSDAEVWKKRKEATQAARTSGCG